MKFACSYLNFFKSLRTILRCINIFFKISILGFVFYNYVKTKNNYILITLFISLAVYLSSLWDNLLRQTAVMWIYFVILAISFKIVEISKEEKI